MSNELMPPMAFNKEEGIRAVVEQIDWGSNSVFVTYPNPDGGVRIGDFWDFGECEISPFVCPDKNGDKVYGGSKVKRVPYTGDPNPHPYQTEGRTGTVAWHHGFLQWCFLDDKTNHMDDLVDSEIFEDGIELIKEPDHDN